MAKDLNDWLKHITALHPQTMDFGLDRIRQVAQAANLLPPAPKNLVVAGTNGKGSTCVFAEALLIAQGYSVGTTLSPHITNYRERFRLNGEIAGEELVVAAFEQVENARKELTLTYFEFSILVAFAVFKKAAVDVAVLEVGLGGRLDAVNLVDADVAVITSIGLDHQDYLGDDIETIGAEKAGILRAHKPLILGSRTMPDSIFALAEKAQVKLVQLGREYDYTEGESWSFESSSLEFVVNDLNRPQLAGDNVAGAIVAVAHLTEPPTRDEVLEAIKKAHLPGRFQVSEAAGRTMVADLAHNPPAAEFLNQRLRSRFPGQRMVAVAGFLNNKDVAAISIELQNTISSWILVPTAGERGQTAQVSKQIVAENVKIKSKNLSCAPSVASAIEKAVSVTGPSDVIVVFGSFSVIQQVFSGGFLNE